jgi:phosphoribosyl-AMP cyclohydrolase
MYVSAATKTQCCIDGEVSDQVCLANGVVIARSARDDNRAVPDKKVWRLQKCQLADWEINRRKHRSGVRYWTFKGSIFQQSAKPIGHNKLKIYAANGSPNQITDNHSMNWLDNVNWDAQGLVPVIAQEQGSNDVLMFAWMNREALQKTAELGRAVYFSRSRAKLWFKGEESGHVQTVHEIRLDCDNDVVLLKVTQLGHTPGIACHTGRHSCFFSILKDGAWHTVEPVLKDPQTIYK